MARPTDRQTDMLVLVPLFSVVLSENIEVHRITNIYIQLAQNLYLEIEIRESRGLGIGYTYHLSQRGYLVQTFILNVYIEIKYSFVNRL